ncbi:hypothetical protein E2562_005209 [Oryza meyeriana var. granulata]|uniref:Uncharacterized protein n=1 Tax=Oryza meyeriana var. granulata TaxID=110450 RepID=A0A6G1BT29_9ORYZ|nr:hypothetical protein E2562_005209 [Oryza meyeriana var. granulata]
MRKRKQYMDSSSGWARTRRTSRLILSPRRGERKVELAGRHDGEGEESTRPRETAHKSTAPAAMSIQIHAMDFSGGRTRHSSPCGRACAWRSTGRPMDRAASHTRTPRSREGRTSADSPSSRQRLPPAEIPHTAPAPRACDGPLPSRRETHDCRLVDGFVGCILGFQ